MAGGWGWGGGEAKLSEKLSLKSEGAVLLLPGRRKQRAGSRGPGVTMACSFLNSVSYAMGTRGVSSLLRELCFP